MLRVPFNLLDSNFLNVELQDEPLNIHVELEFEHRIDEGRLRESVAAACQLHPMARARIEPYTKVSLSNYWNITDGLELDPLSSHRVHDADELARLRDELVSEQPGFEQSPAFRIHLISDPSSDRLVVILNHIIADGLSVFRLINSIMRHYAGEEDPVPEFDPLQKRDLKEIAGSRSLKEGAQRLKALAKTLVQSLEPPERVQGEHAGADRHGYGAVLLELSEQDTARFMARREKPATVNDMLIAAMLLGIRLWNESHGGSSKRISTMMPINVRPQEWWFEVVGNYSTYVSINLFRQCPGDFAAAVRMVTQQTQQLKAVGAHGTLVDLMDIPRLLPAALKAQLRYIVPTLASNLVDTTWVSNLGRLAEPPRMGEAGAVKSFYFTPPSPNPMGLSLGIASMSGQLYLGFRYRKSLLTREAADKFVRLFTQVMLEG